MQLKVLIDNLGFAEVLKSELVLYDIDVHCVFPGSIKTKGFEAENLIKPKITRTLEGDDASTPQQVADGLIKGLKHDNCFIVTEFLGDVLLACGIGFVSRNNAVAHHVWAALGTIIAPGLQLYSWYLIFMEKNGEKKKQ